MTGNVPANVVHENVSRYHFPKAVFEADELREFLVESNYYDEKLFEAISNDR